MLSAAHSLKTWTLPVVLVRRQIHVDAPTSLARRDVGTARQLVLTLLLCVRQVTRV